MGGPGSILTPGDMLNPWVVNCLGFAFHGELSDIEAIIRAYKVTLTNRAGTELWTGPLWMFEPAPYILSGIEDPLEEGKSLKGVAYNFDPVIISSSHPAACLESIDVDRPILTAHLRMDAMLYVTRMIATQSCRAILPE